MLWRKGFSKGIILLALLGSSGLGATQPNPEAQTVNFLKPSIVKIKVTFSESKFDADGNEQCRSEGTGFIVDRFHVMTATHVFKFDQECGTPTILAKSFFYENDWLFNVLDTDGDVALLRIDGGSPSGAMPLGAVTPRGVQPCAAGVSSADMYDVLKALRYGIPAGEQEVLTAETDIGSKKNTYAPRVRLTPIRLLRGESGGPVVYSYVIIGMLRETVVQADLIGLMTPSSAMQVLLRKHKIALNRDDECRLISSVIDWQLDAEPILDGRTIQGSIEVPSRNGGDGSGDGELGEDTRLIARKTLAHIIANAGGAGIRFSDTPHGVTFTATIISDQGGNRKAIVEALKLQGPDLLNSNLQNYYAALYSTPGYSVDDLSVRVTPFDDPVTVDPAFRNTVREYMVYGPPVTPGIFERRKLLDFDSIVAQDACAVCEKEVTLNSELAQCFLDEYTNLASQTGDAVAVNLNDCEGSRGEVAALPTPTSGTAEPDLEFMVSRAQLDCLRHKLEEPGIEFDPLTTIPLDACVR